ncbi:MAG TPA: type II secretion system minor pseudopilin GspK [Candidatus Binataceae bacterium]|nr:type II secretion system minor pseudopilin GspK [Candidatus Binataceae bacterium]
MDSLRALFALVLSALRKERHLPAILRRPRQVVRESTLCPEAQRDGQRGVALLTTLFAMVLITVMVMDFAATASHAERAAANQANSLRAYYLARSAVTIGMALLVQNARMAMASNAPQVDSFLSSWALPYPPLPIAGGWASVSIVDDARKIDINQLVGANGQVNPQYALIVGTLLDTVGAPLSLLPALIDWIDPDSVTTPGGAEADFYMQLMPPYAPRNGPMPTIGDLSMVRGVTPALFERLRNFITTAPTSQININTAPPQVLIAAAPQLAQTSGALQEIMQVRLTQPFTDPSQISQLSSVSNMASNLPSLFTVRSDYFTITGLGSFAGARTFVYATVRRNGIAPVLLLNWSED